MGTYRSRRLLLALSLVGVVGCGAKTGLLIPDADVLPDAGMDAGTDAGTDAGRCIPRDLELERRGAQVMFVIDRSNSMADTLDGREPQAGEPSRWNTVGDVLGQVLRSADPLIEVGGEFYPGIDSGMGGPEEACMVEPGIDLPPRPANAERLLRFFDETGPGGGTPTAVALGNVRDFFERTPAPFVPRFVVLATDGGPNCNPDTGVPFTECVCTGAPNDCAMSPEFGPYNCLDEMRTLGVVDDVFAAGIPVYVIGIDDPTRPDLADVLDRMADAGGRPREVPGSRRFYSVREIDDLRGALTSITDSIAQCVFTLDPAPTFDSELLVEIDGLAVARDRGRMEGWDYTRDDRSELTLFGAACQRVTNGGADVRATILCPDEP